jgi:hypothetical protein
MGICSNPCIHTVCTLRTLPHRNRRSAKRGVRDRVDFGDCPSGGTGRNSTPGITSGQPRMNRFVAIRPAWSTLVHI